MRNRGSSMVLAAAFLGWATLAVGCGGDDGGPGPNPSGCSPANCSGCCSGDQCLPGTAVTQCGTGGAACVACAGGQTCSGGTCTSEPSRCGDGRCDAGETPSGCSQDCPCRDHSECGPNDICYVAACAPALGRDYRITILSGSGLSERDPAGDAWDLIGGLPDPKLCMTIDGVEHCTPPVNDTLNPVWNYSFSVRINASTTYSWQLWDVDDLDEDDQMTGVFSPIPFDVPTLKQGGWTSSGEVGTFEFLIEPL